MSVIVITGASSGIGRALALRQRLYDEPYYRLVHAEADGLPGLVIDRYGDVVVAQLNTAGMAALEGEIVASADTASKIVARDASGNFSAGTITASLSGNATTATTAANFTGPVADTLASGARVLDLYCFSGGFAVAAGLRGAGEIRGIDRSEPALALAAEAASRNGLAERCRFVRAEIFAELAAPAREAGRGRG